MPIYKKDGELSIDSRRQFLKTGVAGAAAAALFPQALAAQATEHEAAKHAAVAREPHVAAFDLEEVSLETLRKEMESGKYSARSLADKYLARIAELDPHVHSVIEVNPDARKLAEELDRERKAKGPRGPLHGIPILIKDNIATADRMQTTAGSLALVGSRPPKDSHVAARLRAAGALILGKTNLSEWANFRSTRSTSGWSGRGGQTNMPYALDRNPSGSSSGSGAAASANFCAIAIGTETDGSIVSPSCSSGLVGIKPTVGLVSRAGIVPISHSQDTAGPMARSVADAATLLSAIAGMDPDDDATAAAKGHIAADYTKFLDARGLRGARIGIVRKLAGYDPHVDKLLDEAIDAMKQAGAEVIDPAEMPTIGKFDKAENTVLQYEFKDGLNKYLAWLGPNTKVHSLQEVIGFNTAHAAEEMPYFDQEIMMQSEARGPLSDEKYQKALADCRRLSRTEGIDATMDKLKLDALVAPTGNAAWPTDLINGDHFTGSASTPAAVAGYPHITVPMGFLWGLPVGISFFGRAWSEPTLIKLAFAYEQTTHHRRAPRFLRTVDLRAHV